MGHEYDGIRYAQWYGRLQKGGDPVQLYTIILSSDAKVYQLDTFGKHAEIRWQNNKAVLKPSYGSIKLTGEGGGANVSLRGPFSTEWSVVM